MKIACNRKNSERSLKSCFGEKSEDLNLFEINNLRSLSTKKVKKVQFHDVDEHYVRRWVRVYGFSVTIVGFARQFRKSC